MQNAFEFLSMLEQAIKYFLNPDCCWLKKINKRKRVWGHLINQLQLQVYLIKSLKWQGCFTLYALVHRCSHRDKSIAGAWPFMFPLNAWTCYLRRALSLKLQKLPVGGKHRFCVQYIIVIYQTTLQSTYSIHIIFPLLRYGVQGYGLNTDDRPLY